MQYNIQSYIFQAIVYHQKYNYRTTKHVSKEKVCKILPLTKIIILKVKPKLL